MTDKILTVHDVALLVKLSEKTVMRAIEAGDLEASRLTQGRGGWRIFESAIPRWMEARSNTAGHVRPLAGVRRVEPANVPRPRPPRRGSAGSRSGRLAA